ncbi:M56 family metallopeptidase [Hamadaea sp. NPDC050747]|uniref:M56 family metallopeptidase n=1 Tax=Hamadaea sp. NPDC050747 TaxID=3155789 RepID=UPI0033F8FBBD
MITAAVAAIVAMLTVAAAGPPLAVRLPPRWAVWLLGLAATGAAASTVFVLGVLTFIWLGQFGEIAEEGHWSPAALRAADPISAQVSIGSGLLLVSAMTWTTRAVLRHLRQLYAWRRIERDLPVGEGSVSVLDSDDVDAFTLPSGRVLITQGMLAALTQAERDIVLAHERSHRVHWHAWWRVIVDLDAAINPLLRPTARAVMHMTERWADEDATRIADRRTVALTIGRIALMRNRRRPDLTVAATGGRIPQRVRALLDSPPRTHPAHLLTVLVLLATLTGTSLAVEHAGEALIENAMHHPTAAETANR